MRGSRERLTADVRVFLIMAGLFALAAVLVAASPRPLDAMRESSWIAVPVIMIGFVLTERFVFRVEHRRETLRVSLAEIPAAFALVFLSPVAAVLTRVMGSLFALSISSKRQKPLKFLFNGSLFASEMAVAAFAVQYAERLFGPLSDGALVAVLIPVALGATGVGVVAVPLVVAQYEGGFWRRLYHDFSRGFRSFTLSAFAGAGAVAPAMASPLLSAIPLVSIVLVWRLYLAHGALGQRLRDLTALHEFTSAVNQSLDLPAVVAAAQAEARRQLRAEFAGLAVFDDDQGGRVMASSRSHDIVRLPQTAHDQTWTSILRWSDGVSRRASTEPPFRDWLPDHWGGGLVAVIRDSEGIVGVLVLAGRHGTDGHFSSDDIARMRPLANQLAVSLRRGLLHIQVEHEARHDRLTGLPNRALFEARISERLAMSQSLTVLLLDLDRFKEVNDGFGHHVGDVLLQRFAERMRTVVGADAVLSRLSGDEFAILATGIAHKQAVEVGTRVLSASRDPFDLGEVTVAISCSIGVAHGPTHGEDATTLLRRADLAMYDAKARSGGLAVFRPDMETSSAERLRLLQDLRVAAISEQMQAYFQPKIELATQRVVGAEALVRWNHPERGTMEAESFVPLAEQTDLIHVITDHVLSSALTAVRGWRTRGYQLGVAVNVSARSLLDELLADRIARHLNHHGVPPELLTIEITETSFVVDADRALVTLDRLDELGVQLSIDDYGTGYSSLTYLRRLPVDELKVDRGFVASMLSDEHDRVIVQSTIDMGRHLGLRVVAEGVEDDEIAAQLRKLGCDLGQGRGFSAPLALPDFNAWLRSSPYGVRRASGGRDQVTA